MDADPISRVFLEEISQDYLAALSLQRLAAPSRAPCLTFCLFSRVHTLTADDCVTNVATIGQHGAGKRPFSPALFHPSGHLALSLPTLVAIPPLVGQPEA